MEGKRSKIDIIGDMLSSIVDKGGHIKPTHLMYKSNMSHVQMKGYLSELVSKEFLAKEKRGNHDYIIITDKGREFLQKLNEMREFEKIFGF